MKKEYFFFIFAALAMVVFLKKDSSKWSDKYDSLFIKYANKFGLDWKMLKAIAIKESTLGEDPRVKNNELSRDGLTYGLMQIKYTTAKYYLPNLTLDELRYKPEKQIEAAAAFLGDLKKKFNGDFKKIVISYNQGETNTAKGRDFTGDYYPKVLKFYGEV